MAEGGEETDIAKALLSGSDSGCDLPCQPCGVDGTMEEGSWFCVTCDEYLCDDCYTHHKKLKLSRHHVVLDKEAMPRDPSKKATVDVCTEPCKQHEGKVIECYCPQHETFGCTVCMAIQHQNCVGLQYIPDVVKDINLDQNEEWSALEQNIDEVRVKIQDLQQNSQAKFEKSKQCSTNAIGDFKTLKQKLYDHFESVEVKLREEVDSITDEDTNTIMQMTKDCDNARDKLEAVVEEYNGLLTLRQRCKIFTLIKNTEKEVKSLGEEFDEKARNIPIYACKFVPKRDILDLMTKQGSVGVINRKYSYNSATYIKDVSTKRFGNSKKGAIRGLVMLSGNMLVAIDRANRQAKVVDVLQCKVGFVFQFSSDPCDIAKLPDDKCAVTLHDSITKQGEIAIMKVNSGFELEMDSKIKVEGDCRGIAYANNKLIVSFFTRGRVDVYSMDGDVMKSFYKDEHGQQLFKCPLYVCYSYHQNTIYVTNCGNYGSPNSVTSLNLDGTVKAVFSDPALNGPLKVVVDAYGSVYVCFGRSHNVHLLSADLSKGSTLIGRNCRVHEPYTVCINEERSEMYVGMQESYTIQVYKLS